VGGVGNDDVVVDFFAGSGTLGHAVEALNATDGGLRRFVLVQLPEATSRNDFSTIGEITKERLRRAGAKLREENPMLSGDLGFRVFKLDSSNIRAWNGESEDVEGQLDLHINHLVDGRTEQDVLYELLLKLGLDLCVPIEERTIAGKTVHSIGGGVLMACLATSIAKDELEPLGQGIVAWHAEQAPTGEAQVVFRDSAFEDDVAKTNMTAILEQNGIKTVRSL
jgi:adenine-specific DNA-methyltransferase